MSEQRAAGQAREQSRLVDGRLRVLLLLLPSHFVWRQHKKSREIAVSLSGRKDPRTRLAFLSGDDGCFFSGGIQLPYMWIPVKLFSSLFFTPFCIQVFKGLIPLKTEKKMFFFFSKTTACQCWCWQLARGFGKSASTELASFHCCACAASVRLRRRISSCLNLLSLHYFRPVLLLAVVFDVADWLLCAVSTGSVLPFGVQQRFWKVTSGLNLVSSQRWHSPTASKSHDGYTENSLKSEAAVFQDTLTFILPNHLPRMEQC